MTFRCLAIMAFMTACDVDTPASTTVATDTESHVDLEPCCDDSECGAFFICGVSGYCTPACEEEPGNACGAYAIGGSPVQCRTDPLSPAGTKGECVLACVGLECPGGAVCGTIMGPAGTKAQACVADLMCGGSSGAVDGSSGG